MDSPQHYRRPYRKTEAPDTRDGARDVTGEERGRQGLKRVVACWALCSPDNIIHAHSRHVSAKTQKGWGFCSRARTAFRLGRSELLQSQLPPSVPGTTWLFRLPSWQFPAADMASPAPGVRHIMQLSHLRSLFVETVGIPVSVCVFSRGTRGPYDTVAYRGAL